MHSQIQHLHASGHDISLSCVLLFGANSLMGWMSSMGFMQWLQLVGILASIVASCYVAFNQHLNIKWKRRKEIEERRDRYGKE